jgi:hypothetical protein
MNATEPRGQRPGAGTTPDAGHEALPADEARQGEVVFGKPWKRQAYFAIVAGLAVLGLVLIVAFT